MNESKNNKGSVVTVYADKGWDSTQATVVHAGRRRHGVSWRVGLDIAAIVGSRYPVLAFANEILNEAATIISDAILSYGHSRD